MSGGAPARYLIGVHWGAGTDSIPWTTFAINIVGAFALGLLLDSLRRAGPDTGRRLKLRLLLGTGFLGTFTTYSSLAVEADLLIHHGRPAVAAGAVARFVTDGMVKRFAPQPFPWGTLIINVVGSFVLGVITGAVIFAGAPSELRILAGVGFCSSYTTFSTAVFESVALARQSHPYLGLVNAVGTIVATMIAAGAGLGLAAI